MSFPFYRQLDSMDCGPACLKMIAKYYGKNISLSSLRKTAQTTKNGTTLSGLCDAAESLGFKPSGARVSYQQLSKEIQLPCIALLDTKHFVVVTKKVRERSITIADPDCGIRKISRQNFESRWHSNYINNNAVGTVLILEPTPKNETLSEENKNNIGWGNLYKYLLKKRKYLALITLCFLISSVLQLLAPALTKGIVDKGINTKNLNYIHLILSAQLALLTGRTLVEFVRARLLLHVSCNINTLILSDFWNKLFKLPLSYFDQSKTGEILQRLNDQRRIESFLTSDTINFIFSSFNLILFSTSLLNYNTIAFLLFVGGSILYLLWIRLFLSFRRTLDYQNFHNNSQAHSSTMQLVYGMQEIKLNNAENIFKQEWETIQKATYHLRFKSLTLSQIQRAGALFINEGKNILITFFVAKAVLDGKLTFGSMLAIQYIIGIMNTPLEQLIGFSLQAQDAKLSLERLNEIHQLRNEFIEQKQEMNTSITNSSITITDLNFNYTGSNNLPVLRNIDLVIPYGKVTAIVGASGSGKTTILKLLQHFYSDYSGKILIGDMDLKSVPVQLWRSQCARVMQDGYIFNDTITRNIALSEIEVDQKRLIHASEVANILSFIETLPSGFNTKIGNEGSGLSAGQKQRVLIARAIYRNPNYLFLDEATNALDANNEMEILQNLESFYTGRTVVIVAHRLSTITKADNVIVLHNGKIVEEGTHEKLSKSNGYYYQLVKNQLQSYD